VGAPNQNPQSLGNFVYNLRMPGQIHDPHAGLLQNHHRDYDPLLGRYVQSDPIGLAGGISTYAYVENDPVQDVDPQGLFGYWPPDSTRRTVICDGKSGVVPQLPPLPEPHQKCLGDCNRQHEISHIVDLRRTGPGLCQGKARGMRPTFDTMEALNQSERRAYDAELACLRAKLRGLSDCDECKKPIESRIEQLPTIRRRYE